MSFGGRTARGSGPAGFRMSLSPTIITEGPADQAGSAARATVHKFKV